MTASLTEDDIGKAVVTEVGSKVGEVTDVEGDTAYVEPDPGIADSIAAALDWEETSDRPLPLESDAVAEIGDETIRLGGEYSNERGDADAAPGEPHGAAADPGEERESEAGDVDRDVDASEFGQDETDLEPDDRD